MRVLVCDNLDAAGVEIFERSGLFEVDVRNDLSHEELVGVIGGYEALVVRSKTKVRADVLEAATRLKVVGRAGTGVDNIDVPAATRRGVVVMNAAAGNTVTTAEHAVAMMMALARNIPIASETTRGGKWEKTKFMGVELANKTLGIVGMGKIGSVVASRALGLAMRVIAFDPYLSREAAGRMGVELVELDELFSRADFVTLHTPLTPETRGIVGRDSIARMKRGVRIINCARGGLVDEAALVEAIREGQVAGAALDVFEQEPIPADHPLLSLEQVVVTPHLGASTEEAQQAVATIVASQIVDYLEKGTIRGAVNFPSLSSEQLAQLRPYIELGERLGGFAGQAFGASLEEVELELSGDLADVDVKPIAQAVLTGLLRPASDRVNYVNAAVVADEAGIRVRHTTTSQARDYAGLITVRLRSSGREHEVAGAILGSSDARIVRVDGFAIEAVPSGQMVLLSNRDVPGVIGRVATTLGDSGINISRFYLGRRERGGDALALIEVDDPVGDAVLASLEAIPDVTGARRVTL